MEARRSPNWQRGITYLELNSSNLCNLQCRHCCSVFSSRWSQHEHRHGRPAADITRPDRELLLRSLAEVDMRHLDYVSIKGGEPMLNADVRTLLEHLQQIGVFGNVVVDIVTNGTVVDPATLALLRAAKEVRICLSIDGVGAVQPYIRHGGSGIDKVERSIAIYAAMPNVTLTRNTSVMVYNVFQLDAIDAWWTGLGTRFPGRYLHPDFSLLVLSPEALSIACLQDHTRAALAAKYAALDPRLYGTVVAMLRAPFAGAERHDAFVDLTESMDRELGCSVLDAVPELAPEMARLLPQRQAAVAPAAVAPAVVAPAAVAPAPPPPPPPPPPAAPPPAEPADASGWIDAGWRAVEAGALPEADTCAQRAHAVLAADDERLQARCLHLRAAVAALTGDVELGIELATQALQLQPGHAGLLQHRARMLDARGNRAGT
jgi:hypothetical protein